VADTVTIDHWVTAAAAADGDSVGGSIGGITIRVAANDSHKDTYAATNDVEVGALVVIWCSRANATTCILESALSCLLLQKKLISQ